MSIASRTIPLSQTEQPPHTEQLPNNEPPPRRTTRDQATELRGLMAERSEPTPNEPPLAAQIVAIVNAAESPAGSDVSRRLSASLRKLGDRVRTVAVTDPTSLTEAVARTEHDVVVLGFDSIELFGKISHPILTVLSDLAVISPPTPTGLTASYLMLKGLPTDLFPTLRLSFLVDPTGTDADADRVGAGFRETVSRFLDRSLHLPGGSRRFDPAGFARDLRSFRLSPPPLPSQPVSSRSARFTRRSVRSSLTPNDLSSRESSRLG